MGDCASRPTEDNLRNHLLYVNNDNDSKFRYIPKITDPGNLLDSKVESKEEYDDVVHYK